MRHNVYLNVTRLRILYVIISFLHSFSFTGNINTNTSLTSLMLQSGMTRDQISMLAATGLTSSASLANLLTKQRSFDQHLNMDFQSMQSFEDLSSMIQGGMPNQTLPKAQMKNMDWGSQSIGATGMGNLANPGLVSYANRQPTANAATISSGLMNMNSQMENAAYGHLIQNATTLQGRNFAGDQTGGATMNDFNSYIQSLASQSNQQQQIPAVNYGSLLQGIGGSLQNNSQDGHRNNSLLNLLNQSAMSIGNTAQAQSFRPFNQNLQNDSFAGVSQGNPMIMALAQQQLLAQAGKVNNCSNVHLLRRSICAHQLDPSPRDNNRWVWPAECVSRSS